MRDSLTGVVPPVALQLLGRALIWVLFFASSVYGHVALKLSVNGGHRSYAQAMMTAATSWWGWSTVAAWGLSCIFWVLAISKHKLIIASSISSFSYVLICLAAWLFLGERVTSRQCAGVFLSMAGIFFVK